MAWNYAVSDLPEYRLTAEREAITAGRRWFVGYDTWVVTDGVVRIQTFSGCRVASCTLSSADTD